MSEYGTSRVVAGVDGSVFGREAARWAAREALRRQVRLRLVYGDVFALPTIPELPGIGWPKAHHGEVREQVEHWLDQAAESARHEASAVDVETVVRAGQPATVLLEESKSASLLVVGDRGFGGFIGLLAGSVAVAVAARSTCPTVVVRESTDSEVRRDGVVVVGIDGSPATDDVLTHAFDLASSYAVPLHVVHAWHVVGADSRWIMDRLGSAEIRSDKEALVGQCLAGFAERYPDVEVHRFVGPGSPSRVLMEHARDAHVIVVGSRGHGGLTGMVLGSTSQPLIHHAPCPVIVMPSRSRENSSARRDR